MIQSRYKQHGGWYGNSQGHAMAARGMRLYASKQVLVDPLFYAQKREEQVSFSQIVDEVKQGSTYDELKVAYPDVDKEDLRMRGIKAISSVEGGTTLSAMDHNGVDVSVKLASMSPSTKRRMLQVLNDRQQSSFLPSIKVDLLKKRLGELQ